VAGDQGAGGGLIVSLIAAVGRNGVIGYSGQGMPWRLSSDLKRLKALTMGKPFVMGRKTFDSIGRPLPGRDMIVVTRDPNWTREGVRVAGGLDEALALVSDAPEVMIGGGGEIYRLAWDRADRIYLTEVDLAPDADVLFPVVDPAQWREIKREAGVRGPKDEADFCFVEYERR
jgi:dihydrofolate reductase